MNGSKFRNISAIALSVAVFTMASTPADARRGGSFGSRGARTAVAPPTTTTAPKQVAPVQRTMADKQAANPSAANPAAANARTAPAKSGGLAKGLIGGLIAGGLIGMLLGNGFGAFNGTGILMALLQVAMIGGLVWLALRMFRRRPRMAAAGVPGMTPYSASPFSGAPQPDAGTIAQPRSFAPPASRDLAVTMADKEAFERLLGEVQEAFAAEDYARLRGVTTPEVMSYLAEELSQNATRGLRNDVSGTELLEAEVAEAWEEQGADYATIAMQYQSIEVMRDRSTGEIVEGDPTQPTRTTELWTFVRDNGHDWRLSAIQQA